MVIGRGNCLIDSENKNDNGIVVFSIVHTERDTHTQTCRQEIMNLGPDVVPFKIGVLCIMNGPCANLTKMGERPGFGAAHDSCRTSTLLGTFS